jgi:hypothetical protein
MYADLVLTSKVMNLDDIDILLSLHRRHYHSIGDSSLTKIVLDYSSWTYTTDKLEVFLLNEITNKFCDIIEPRKDTILSLIEQRKCNVHFCFVIHEEGENYPGLGLNERIIKLAYELNATIDIDGIY